MLPAREGDQQVSGNTVVLLNSLPNLCVTEWENEKNKRKGENYCVNCYFGKLLEE